MSQGKISKKQQEILEYIKSQILQRGFPPAVREICEAVNLKSTSSVHSHLETLEKNVQEDGTVVPVAMRQIKGIAAAMNVPMPVVIAQIPSDQELVVHVVAESDQPHAK